MIEWILLLDFALLTAFRFEHSILLMGRFRWIFLSIPERLERLVGKLDAQGVPK